MTEVSKSRILRIIPLILIVLLFCPFAHGRIIHVDDDGQADFDNIQAGIDAADDGDTVLVAPGEYVITEPITFRRKAITVKSEVGRDETTIRMDTPADPNRASVIIFENNETDASVLEGFTITGGKGSLLEDKWGGGGIFFINASSATVINCAIVQNRAESGGAIACNDDSSMTMTNCNVRDNVATGTTWFVNGYGGALVCRRNSSMTINNCTFGENSAGVGGGVLFNYESYVTMTNCVMTGNTAHGWGGAIQCPHASTVLTNCVIARNSAGINHGGLLVEEPFEDIRKDSSLVITNCTIWGNSAGEKESGISCVTGASATIKNSIIRENTATGGAEIRLELDSSILSISYSNIAGGQYSASVKDSTLNWGVGNIDADPLFADPNRDDFHLKSQAGRWDPTSQIWVKDDVTSPCINAGDPNSDWSGETWPHGQRINIGAYGGTAEASMSAEYEGMSLPSVVYIYDDEVEAMENFKSLLEMYGVSVHTVSFNDLEQVLLSDYDLIVAGDDTGWLWTFDNVRTAAVEDSGKPVLGLGKGGYTFFGELGLWIGNPNGGYDSYNSISVIEPEHSLFSTPYQIEIPDDGILQLYTETDSIGIYLWPDVPETVFVIGRKFDDAGYYPLAMEHDRYLLWGFTESPEKMTEVGKRLFINVVIWMKFAMAARADLNDDYHVDLRDFAKLAQYWMQDEGSVDIYPQPGGDGVVNWLDLSLLVDSWLAGIAP
jgi:hypothetical protein